ncbi:hypothetical protein [Lysobacter gummosus]|uniref:hypothetical protein n=1 Tax=Lysobacter gummosus TaxID=262324 RepID=UPI00362559B1
MTLPPPIALNNGNSSSIAASTARRRATSSSPPAPISSMISSGRDSSATITPRIRPPTPWYIPVPIPAACRRDASIARQRGRPALQSSPRRRNTTPVADGGDRREPRQPIPRTATHSASAANTAAAT